MEELGLSGGRDPACSRGMAFEDPQTIGNAREVDVAAYEETLPQRFLAGAALSIGTRDYSMVVGGRVGRGGSGRRWRRRALRLARPSEPFPRARARTRGGRSRPRMRPGGNGPPAPPSSAPTSLEGVADLVHERRDDLARTLTLDQGKPFYSEAYGEVGELEEYFRMAAADATRIEGSCLPRSTRGSACSSTACRAEWWAP